MQNYIWIPLIPLSFVLGFQDWRSREVNLLLVLATVVIMLLGVKDFYLCAIVFIGLGGYRYFRSHSIQPIDIFLFSIGAGYFTVPHFAVYCFVTALGLFGLSNFTQDQRLPFVVAWAMGFWVTLVLQDLLTIY